MKLVPRFVALYQLQYGDAVKHYLLDQLVKGPYIYIYIYAAS